jgi:hypothetical protein
VNPASLRYAVTGFVSASASIIMVPGGGLEPPRPYGQRILSPLSLVYDCLHMSLHKRLLLWYLCVIVIL